MRVISHPVILHTRKPNVHLRVYYKVVLAPLTKGHFQAAPSLCFKARPSQVQRYWYEDDFYLHTNKTHFHKKGFALSLFLKVRVFSLGNGWLLLYQDWRDWLMTYITYYSFINSFICLLGCNNGGRSRTKEQLLPWSTSLNCTVPLLRITEGRSPKLIIIIIIIIIMETFLCCTKWISTTWSHRGYWSRCA